jgi:cytochrome c oxidase subunit 1
MLIAVPTGIKVFNWIATMWGGRLWFATPMLFATAFLLQFTVAGLTGIMLAVAPFDWQLTDSYFVVAHFHYVLIGGLLFTLFAAIYYWFPKATGRKLDERLGRWHFWLLVIGFNLTFAPMHMSGMLGMPRRIYTYQADRGWELWNMLSTVGVAVQALAIAIWIWNVVRSLRRGEAAGDDPWNAWTLEWATTSPPPPYNFEMLPSVRSRRPLWDLKHPEDPDWRYE